MTLQELTGKLRQLHERSGTQYTPQTSVVSPLFPGQFNYCLDERHLFEKYGNLIDLQEEHFQKIQPAIRLADFDTAYGKQSPNGNDHLGTFTLSTVSGGHVISANEGTHQYDIAVKGMLDFMRSIGLDESRLKVTYFSGNTAKNVEASRKKNGQSKRVLVESYIPADDLAVQTWGEYSKELALEGCNTRDNFLTTNWDVTTAPWGYRNEILYNMPDGRWLDIGTIERCTMRPVVEQRGDGLERYVTDIKPWDKCFVVDSVGLERLALALEGRESIYATSLLEPLAGTGYALAELESARMLHRVFSDADWKSLSPRRKEKTNALMRKLDERSLDGVKDILRLNARQYASIFPELAKSVDACISELAAYRERRPTGKGFK
ncbi:hypothetical protein HY489_03450 [Candidatus Woesearchaeota archaeon]|nr:hypothetical protein [Candidatus Woesearchaeota archaeon]